jgi:hypothetical protein
MTDRNWAYQQIGKDYAAHSRVKHSVKEFVRGDVHNNTAVSFNSLQERANQGIFHHMSQKHLPRYLNEIGFRSAHRVPGLLEVILLDRLLMDPGARYAHSTVCR